MRTRCVLYGGSAVGVLAVGVLAVVYTLSSLLTPPIASAELPLATTAAAPTPAAPAHSLPTQMQDDTHEQQRPSIDDGEDRDDTAAPNPQVAAPPAPRISSDRAAQAALARFPGASVHEVELEDEGGAAVYEVELIASGMEHKLDVDASNGAVLHVETEDGD